MNSAFLFDCRNCEYCFGATNKRNKKYLWLNEQLTQTEWEKRFSEVDLGSQKNTKKYLDDFYRLMAEQGIWPENFNDNVTDSTGEYLSKTVSVKNSYSCDQGAVNQYSCNFSIGTSQDNAFTGYPVFGHDQYYCVGCSRGGGSKFSFLTIQSNNMEYCLLCYNCETCFGCIGLQRKQFCIFNKQYTEEEYWKRVDELKCAMLERGEYGEFIPTKFSLSYYKDSGVIWFGATEAEMKKIGVLDFDPESAGATGQDLADASKLRQVEELPDHIKDLDDSWIGVPLLDTSSNRRFSLIKPEIEFYRRKNIAPPAKHFILRVHDLWLQTNLGRFEPSVCLNCGKQITVAINVAHKIRRIYCRECYLRHLEQNG